MCIRDSYDTTQFHENCGTCGTSCMPTEYCTDSNCCCLLYTSQLGEMTAARVLVAQSSHKLGSAALAHEADGAMA